MNNNELFIDTMDKINTVAKSRGFVNGFDWAKAANAAKEINDMILSAFENCHSLRNLMAHGSARDITISGETIGEIVTVLSVVSASKLKPLPKKEELDRNDPEKFVQVGDFVLFPFFNGSLNLNGTPRVITKFSDVYMEELSQKISGKHTVGGLICRVTSGKRQRLGRPEDKTLYDTRVLAPHPLVGEELKEIIRATNFRGLAFVLRPTAELRAALASCKDPMVTTKYTYKDGMLQFTVAVFKNGRCCDFIGGYELKTYSCRAYVITKLIAYGIMRDDNKELAADYLRINLGNDKNIFASYPPQHGQPYYTEYLAWQNEVSSPFYYSNSDEPDLPF